MSWRFKGPHGSLELQGCVYPSLIIEFYVNFQHKNGEYISLVNWKLIVLNAELFLVVGGLASSAAPLGDCNNNKWSDFDSTSMYISCLRGPHYFFAGELTKAGSLLVEYRLLHYLIANILEDILVNWPSDILKVMDGITKSSSILLAYGIFISRVIDHLDIDTSDVGKLVMIPREH
ncbi:hypothetical protein Lal_00042194 [Lupinus albus]|nr:hypothetical protein Lal_00042194 [Lupinus albus]